MPIGHYSAEETDRSPTSILLPDLINLSLQNFDLMFFKVSLATFDWADFAQLP